MSPHLNTSAAREAADTNVINALLLDDSAFDRQRIRRMNDRLDRPLILEDVATIEDMTNCLDRKRFDLIMIDYGLGQDDGLSALDLIQKHNAHQDVATIMISGAAETSVAVSALKRGCDDYVSKTDLTLEVFDQSVTGVLAGSRGRFYPEMGVDDPVAFVRSGLAFAMAEAVKDVNLHELLVKSFSEAMQQAAYDIGVAQGIKEARDVQLLMSGLQDQEMDEFLFRS